MSVSPVPERPLAARIAQLGVLTPAIWNLARAAALWHQADWQTGLAITPDPRIRLAVALVWAALFFIALVGLRRRKIWSRKLIPILLALYGVYELGMIIVFSTLPPAVLPILAYIVFVGLVYWALRRPGYFPLSETKEAVEPHTL